MLMRVMRERTHNARADIEQKFQKWKNVWNRRSIVGC